jgi:hypothetical protein
MYEARVLVFGFVGCDHARERSRLQAIPPVRCVLGSRQVHFGIKKRAGGVVRHSFDN